VSYRVDREKKLSDDAEKQYCPLFRGQQQRTRLTFHNFHTQYRNDVEFCFCGTVTNQGHALIILIAYLQIDAWRKLRQPLQIRSYRNVKRKLAAVSTCTRNSNFIKGKLRHCLRQYHICTRKKIAIRTLFFLTHDTHVSFFFGNDVLNSPPLYSVN